MIHFLLLHSSSTAGFAASCIYPTFSVLTCNWFIRHQLSWPWGGQPSLSAMTLKYHNNSNSPRGRLHGASCHDSKRLSTWQHLLATGTAGSTVHYRLLEIQLTPLLGDLNWVLWSQSALGDTSRIQGYIRSQTNFILLYLNFKVIMHTIWTLFEMFKLHTFIHTYRCRAKKKEYFPQIQTHSTQTQQFNKLFKLENYMKK